MLAVELKDLGFFRHMLRLNIEKWNKAVEMYIMDLYPDVKFTFSTRDQCWKATDTEIVYYVDIEVILINPKYDLCWTHQDPTKRLQTINGILLSSKAKRTKLVTFDQEYF
ncbi:hypothetical protein DPMN_089780 [Dreissena polymorpha]|jgi:hypothetical protein|uniref:Uncharacterized protein n=1 Tax=Dreissena polymorpha TaxID=45954 RepID=A0A9D4IZU4_DREPO|nr:hypothetical protein DPMN_191247 [Dreissena polymorpha]KAH3717681.1 hypothetical protein DPMN_060476 [Dreissena polymorpha]KAH3725974.1 hypothetical protein DPMN_051829 [Dreissena polymorpha]KAH3730602.1 hypothetical protein DPMN_056592 [Dreissena polymorpha]KAH3741693.1 hypothetical protein DPMN_048418 [Dreissena polymorpha]